MSKVKLEDFLDYVQPTRYIVSSEIYSNDFETPVLTAGKTFILGYTDDKDGIYDASINNPIILFDDFTTASRWVDFPFKVKSSACKILVPKQNVCLKYAFYAMNAIDFDNSNHQRYWISKFSKLPIEENSKEEQLKIVDKLDNIQREIDIKKQELFDLNELIKSRFIEMFGHQDQNENNYEIKTIDDVAKIYLGLTYTPTYTSEGVKFISAKDISKDYLDYSDLKYISREEYEKAPIGARPKKNDVLFSRVGSNLGHPVILESDDEFCSFVSLGFLRTNGLVNSNYLKYWMKDDYFKSQLSHYVVGAAKANLNTGWLKKFSIIVPPIELQNKFASFVELIDKSKLIVEKQINDLQELLDSKMNKYFGE